MAIVDSSCMIFYWKPLDGLFGFDVKPGDLFWAWKNQALGDFPDGLPFSHPFMAPWLWSPHFCVAVNQKLVSLYNYFHMGVSKNRGFPPKSSILIGFSSINHPFWGIHIFWKHPYLDFADLFWSCRFSFWWIVRDFLCVEHLVPCSTFYYINQAYTGNAPTEETCIIFFHLWSVYTREYLLSTDWSTHTLCMEKHVARSELSFCPASFSALLWYWHATGVMKKILDPHGLNAHDGFISTSGGPVWWTIPIRFTIRVVRFGTPAVAGRQKVKTPSVGMGFPHGIDLLGSMGPTSGYQVWIL